MNEIISLLFDSLTSPDPMLTLLIWGLYAGALIGILISLITRRGTHKAVSAIVKAKAVDRDSARTIAQLGLDGSYFAKRALRPSSPVLKYVKAFRPAAGEKGKHKYDGVRFWLPEENRIGAEVRFREERRPVMTFILAAVILFAAAFLAIRFVPQFIEVYSSIGG